MEYDLTTVEKTVFEKTGELSPDAVSNSYRLNESDGFCSVNADYKLVKYPVTAGDIIEIESDDRFQFQTVASVPASGISNRVGITYGVGNFILRVPNTATYLIISTPLNGIAKTYSFNPITNAIIDEIDSIQDKIHSNKQYLYSDKWLDHKYWNSNGSMSTSAEQYNYHAYPAITLQAGTYYLYECGDAYSFKKVGDTISSLDVEQLNYSPYKGKFTLTDESSVMLTASPSHTDTSIMMLVNNHEYPSDASIHDYNSYFGDYPPQGVTFIVVDQNGQGDYTNLQDAFDNITGDSDASRVNILVMPGIYPRFDSKRTSDSTWSERYINIIGVDVDNTVILSDVGLYSKATNLRINGVVKNLTFKMTNDNQEDVSQEPYSYAYAVHADFGYQHCQFENCKFSSTNGPAVGFGIANNSFLKFVGCYFECNQQNSSIGTSALGALFGHSTNTPNATGIRLETNNCICNNKTGINGAVITTLVESTVQSFISTNSIFVGTGGYAISVTGEWGKEYSANISDCQNSINSLNDDVTDIKEDLTDIQSDLNYSKTAPQGYILTATDEGNGTEWSPVGLPTDEQTAQAVNDWLDEHPEATTTVQDGSITKNKLNANLKDEIFIPLKYYISDAETLQSVLSSEILADTVYYLGNIILDSPIELSTKAAIRQKAYKFIGGRITINASHAFHLPTNDYYIFPTFCGTDFVGNHNILFYNETSTYPVHSYFSDCRFINVKLVTNGSYVQDSKFTQCRFISDSINDTFIKCGIVNDCVFQSCVFDSDFLATIIDANGYYNGNYSEMALKKVMFDSLTIEGRFSNKNVPPFIIMASGQVIINGLSSEAIDTPLIYKKYAENYGNKKASQIIINDSFVVLNTGKFLCCYDPEDLLQDNNNDLIISNTLIAYGSFAAIRSISNNTVVYEEINRNSGLRVFNTVSSRIDHAASLNDRQRMTSSAIDSSELLWRNVMSGNSIQEIIGENEIAEIHYTPGQITSTTIKVKRSPCIISYYGGFTYNTYPFSNYVLYVASPKVDTTNSFTPTVKWIVPPPESDDIIINAEYDNNDPYTVIITFSTTSGKEGLLNYLNPSFSSQYSSKLYSYAVYASGLISALYK